MWLLLMVRAPLLLLLSSRIAELDTQLWHNTALLLLLSLLVLVLLLLLLLVLRGASTAAPC